MFTHGSIGLFGKIPAQGDFLRLRVADPAAQQLVLWFEEGVAAIHRNGSRLAGDPVRFLFRAPGAPSFLVGAFVSSGDKVGRGFPLAVFVPVQGEEAGAQFPMVPRMYRSFLDAAVALLAESPALDGRQMGERIQHLPLPDSADLADTEVEVRRAIAAESASRFSERVFGNRALEGHYYGFWTFRSACQPVRGQEPARANVAVDCPTSADVDLFAWLDMAQRALRWPAPPPFFWRDGEEGHLLLSLGPASGALLAYLSDPGRTTNRVWPLKTTQIAAVQAARQALGPSLIGSIDNTGAKLEDLIDLLSR